MPAIGIWRARGSDRLERVLEAALGAGAPRETPPHLLAAMRAAVLPGGGRVRPRLLMAVAAAHGEDAPALTEAAAAAVELIHCASLVHDDLPCFDDAATRRGRPTVHRRFGVETAVLTGDALIVLAFELLGRAASRPDVPAQRCGPLVTALGRSAGAFGGLAAGQAWESAAEVHLGRYHRAKTAALFEAAAAMGALSAGAEPTPWRAMARHIGEAYQVADDLADALGDAANLGKPVDRDATLARPNAVHQLGIDGARARLGQLCRAAIEAIPLCPGRGALVEVVETTLARLVPEPEAEPAVG